MSMAYAVILVSTELYDSYQRDTVQEAQHAADKKFEALAQAAMKGTVTRNPEPRVMTYDEMRQAFPELNLNGIVGLYFTADIV